MSVLLEGLQFPHGNPITINIYRDGSWCDAYTTEDGKAIEVPTPHGDLIDAFAFRIEMDTNYPFDKFTQSKYGEANAAKSTILMMLGKAPTIIEAEE